MMNAKLEKQIEELKKQNEELEADKIKYYAEICKLNEDIRYGVYDNKGSESETKYKSILTRLKNLLSLKN